MREGLHHKYSWSGKQELFYKHIEETGGWDESYKFIGFCHTDGREAGFTNSSNNDGWWTVLASSDDYYIWKLSDAARQRIVDGVLSRIRIPKINFSDVEVKNSRGYFFNFGSTK